MREEEKELTMDLENWKEQLKEDWGLDDVAGVYYKGYSLGHQMDDLESYISKLLSSQLKEVLELVQSNTEGTFTDDGGNDCWYIDKLVEAIKGLAEVEKLV